MRTRYQTIKPLVITALSLFVSLAGSVSADTDWTSTTGDGNWMNPGNWDPILPISGDRVNIESTSPLVWPTLSRETVHCGQLRLAYAESTVGELTVNGGAHLNIEDELRFGRKKSSPLPTGWLFLHGEDTHVFVSELIECGRYGNGVIEMTGGTLRTEKHLRLAYRDGSSGLVFLKGGTIDLGANPGITVGAGAGNKESITSLIDISGGTLILAGDQVATILTYVEEGIITAFNGTQAVLVEFDGNQTIVNADLGINKRPMIDAGITQRIMWPENTVQLDAVVTDDDPCNLGLPTLKWTLASGPPEGHVTFYPSDAVEDPSVWFSGLGVYELRLQAWDSGTLETPPKTAFDTVTITIKGPDGVTSNGSFLIKRLNHGEPIITESMFKALGATPEEGEDINGPSLIRIPDWIAPANRVDPTAQYYLYFANHHGNYIRMAWAVDIEGPWYLYRVGPDIEIGERGVLDLGSDDKINIGNGIVVNNHIASPEVFADEKHQRIVLYFHGPSNKGGQRSFVGTSELGLDFNNKIEPVVLGGSYFRVFPYGNRLYAFDNSADLYVAPDPNHPWLSPDDFDFNSTLWTQMRNDPLGQDLVGTGLSVRHTAVRLVDDTLQVFYSRRGDAPERLLLSTIDLTVGDPNQWDATYPPEEILHPELDWEGAKEPLIPSKGGWISSLANQLRDPYVFEDVDSTLYLFYAGGGEQSIGLAELIPLDHDDSEF
ncbi:hypothetical protein ACFL6U_23080 [Planctomycetota bacterium]